MNSFCCSVLVSLLLGSWTHGYVLKGCGITTAPLKRIEPSRPSNSTSWPWMVALLKDGGIHYCGAVLISKQHVLTAAHCIAPFKLESIRARFGEYDLGKDQESRHMDYRIAQSFIHEAYDRATYENDIAILKVQKSLISNSYIWPICMPPKDMSWGTIYYGGPPSDVLLQVDVPVWNQNQCVQKFSQPILETHLCAGAYGGGKDSCQGDSGGPLMYFEDDKWMTVGIVSWGINCGQDTPGIYTRVNKYLDWISQKMSL
ncbi:Venom serine protease Bi-VSP [Gryllus bimaculatus]|nr:Venom serine protease Bi-VSP [Gryllus bimaculatus]